MAHTLGTYTTCSTVEEMQEGVLGMLEHAPNNMQYVPDIYEKMVKSGIRRRMYFDREMFHNAILDLASLGFIDLYWDRTYVGWTSAKVVLIQ